MTIACLIENTIEAFLKKLRNRFRYLCNRAE